MDNFRLKKTSLIAVSVFAAAMWTALFAQATVDDAFIFFRYGKTLHLHHLWNWNPSGAPIEAYTSSLYGFLSIFPPLLHVPPALLFKLIGLASVLMMAYLLNRSAEGRISAWVAITLLFCQPYTWVHAYSCLETPLFMLLILWLSLAIQSERMEWWNCPAVAYSVAFLLPLVRPEGAVLGLAGIILYSKGRSIEIRDRLLIALFALAEIAYFVMRYRYFHYLLPNPFYVKVAHGSIGHFLSNLDTSKWLLFALLGCLLLTRKLKVRLLLVTGILLMSLLYFPHVLAMDYCNRFAFQVAFPLALSVLPTIAPAEVEVLETRVVFVFVLCLFSFSIGELHSQLLFYPYLEAAHVQLGEKLAPFASGHSLLAGDMGSLPYFSDWMSYDFLGLCTNDIAHRGLSASFLERIRPDLVLLYSTTGTDYVIPHVPQQQIIMAYMQAEGHYKRIGAVRWRDFYLVEFLRDDTPQFGNIEHALDAANAKSAGFVFHVKDLLEQKYLVRQFKGL